MIKFKETVTHAKWFPVAGEVALTYNVEQQNVNEPKLYIGVETPEGNAGKDIAGIYDEYAEALARSEQIEQLLIFA